jgi:hypothetical protein
LQRELNRRVTLSGDFTYEYEGTQSVTEFAGFLNFNRSDMPLVDWKHIDAR